MTYPPQALLVGSTVALFFLVCFAIVTLPADGRWGVSLFQAGVFGLAAVWIVWLLVRPFRLAGHVLLIPLAGTALWGLVQLGLNRTVYRFETWTAVLAWTANLLVFFVVFQACQDSEIRRNFRQALLYFGFLLSIVATLQYFTSEGKAFWVFPVARFPNGHFLGPFVNYDHYATLIELLLPIALYKAITDRQRVLLYSGTAGAMFASVIAGASRTGSILVTVEIALMLLPVILGRTGRTRIGFLAKVAVFVVTFTAVVGMEALWQRFEMLETNAPYLSRWQMVEPTLRMIRERPWMGFGLNTWPTVYPAYATVEWGVFVNHAHNDWAEWAADGGIPFFLMMLSVFVWAVRNTVRVPWGLGIVAALLHSVVDFPMTRVAVVLFAVLGAMAAASQSEPPRRRARAT
jgi:O-antigen ligase